MRAYSYGVTSGYVLVYLSVDPNEQILVLASFSSGVLKYLVHTLDSEGIPVLANITGDRSFSAQPYKIFIRN
jgi:hypothetical protein